MQPFKYNTDHMKAHAYKPSFYVCSDRLFLLKLYFILHQGCKHVKVQINEYMMTMKPVFKVSFGGSAFGQ